MKKFKEICKKIADALSVVFGYGIAACLILGGLTFFGFLAAIIIGGAQVNGAYAEKASTNYVYDTTSQAVVATVKEESYVFGNEAGEDAASIGTVVSGQDGSYAKLYTVDEDGKATLVEKPAVDTAYKLGITNEANEICYVNGEMTDYRLATTTDYTASIDVYLEQGEDAYKIYTPAFDEEGNPAVDEEGNPINDYINMVISGGTGYEITNVIKSSILPVVIYASTILVLLGLFIMYLRGETALTPDKKKASKHEGEM